ncbi:MAG: glycosyltransferase [Thermodesulfobacteriota bacterium]
MKKTRFSTDMSKRILLGCFEPPGYGGAATAAYKLFEMMQDDGFDVCYLNLIEEQDADYFRYVFGENLGNPKGLHNVYSCSLNGPNYIPHQELVDLINYMSPDILVGIGWIAALLMKRAAPEKRSIFLTSGCELVKDNISIGKVKDFISLNESIRRSKRKPALALHYADYDGWKLFEPAFSQRQTHPVYNGALPASYFEKEAARISNLIVTHSDTIRFLYQYLFPSYIEKVYPDVIWFAEWIHKDALNYSGLQKPFYERDIDILFIASAWSRPEKNYKLVNEIVSRCNGLNIHIVGEVEEKLTNAEHHGLVTKREELFGLLGRAKTVVCPSLFDTAPGILFEASTIGCNIIASKNCGNWQICNETLLVDPFKLDNFLEKIQLSLQKKYEDNMEYFIKTDSYKNLLDTILVF